LPTILIAQVEVTRAPADIVSTFKASVVQTDFAVTQCPVAYLFNGANGWQGSLERLNLPSLAYLQAPFGPPPTTYTASAGTQSIQADVPGIYNVVVKLATGCAAYVEHASLTVMVLNR
jgi:hypothetical protein